MSNATLDSCLKREKINHGKCHGILYFGISENLKILHLKYFSNILTIIFCFTSSNVIHSKQCEQGQMSDPKLSKCLLCRKGTHGGAKASGSIAATWDTVTEKCSDPRVFAKGSELTRLTCDVEGYVPNVEWTLTVDAAQSMGVAPIGTGMFEYFYSILLRLLLPCTL